MKNSELRELINSAYDTADALYETPFGQYFAERGIKPFQELLMLELVKYVAYLGNVKGFATEREAVLFKDCYTENQGYIGVRQAQAALDSDLEGKDFGETIPFLLSAYCLIDIEFYNNKTDLDATASRLYIDLFKEVGQFFLEYHGSVDYKEKCVVYEYIEFLENTRNEKLQEILQNNFIDADVAKNTINCNEDESKNCNEKKKDVLLNSFETIKGDYENARALSEIVIKMFELDVDTAIDMWSYLLTEYETQAMWYSWDLTGYIMMRGGNVIGQDVMDKLILSNPRLKRILITKKCALGFGGALELIRRKIENNELQIADELLQALYENPDREDSWYDVIDKVMPNGKISSDAIELLEMWCDRVQNPEARAKLSVKMLEYMD